MENQTTIVNLAKILKYQDDAIVSKEILRKAGGTITIFAFDKHQGLSEHKTPFEAMVYILDGEATITVGGQAYHLKKGESIIMPAQIPHAVKAITKFKMSLSMIKTI